MELIYYPGIRGINTQVTNIFLQNTAYSSLLFNSLPSHMLGHRQQQNKKNNEENRSLLLSVQKIIMESQNHVGSGFPQMVLTTSSADKPWPPRRAGVRP